MAWQAERFTGRIGITDKDSRPTWRLPPRPPDGTPNVVYIVVDDVGFAQLGCYGSDIETPHIDELAQNGLRYNNFHTTAMCSPTRSCLMTGRNHHTAGMGLISELAQGYPGYHGMPPETCGYISEVLQAQGFATLAVGKWHLSPPEEMSMAGPFHQWPLGRGFDRFYGFLGAETNQYYPDLVYDNHLVEPPGRPEDGYHLTNDLTERAIAFIRDLRSADRSKPFFLYFCPGTCHAPHQAPREYIERYKGRFDQGWDAWREAVYQRQLDMVILPRGTMLTERPEWVQPWDALSETEKRLFAREMEVFAGFLTHLDDCIGQFVQAIDELGEMENTLIIFVSDNGASGEGGYYGSFNENLVFNGVPDTVEQNLKHLDDLGGPKSYGHYATRWTLAGSTPFKRWKRLVHNGGICDPMIVHWPAAIESTGEIRQQYVHAIDVSPTVLDILGIAFPDFLKGIPQEEIAGTSCKQSLLDAKASEHRLTQYYEMYGNRAIYHDGWCAVSYHPTPGVPSDGKGDPTTPILESPWELYNLREDYSQTNDLAQKYPEKLQELVGLWFAEAGRYQVFPLHSEQQKGLRPKPNPDQQEFIYWPGTARIDNEVAVNLRFRPFNVLARVTIPAGGAEGVLIAQGGEFGGWAFFVKERTLYYEHNFLGLQSYRVASTKSVPEGPVELGLEFTATGKYEISPELTSYGIEGVSGMATLYINGEEVGSGLIAKTVPFSWSLTGEGLCCGYDSETPVSALYESPFTFTGAIDRVVVSVKGEPYRNFAKEVEKALMTQ